MWPGSPVPKFEPDYLVDYERGITAQHKMETALGWLDMPFEQRPQMISIYVPQVDQKGHGGGPQGGQVSHCIYISHAYVVKNILVIAQWCIGSNG